MSAEANSSQEKEAQEAREYNERGLQQYERWEMNEAINSFKRAIELSPQNPDYSLNIARALTRLGKYEEALRALAEFIYYESNEELVERFKQMFSNRMDEVERLLTHHMAEKGMPIEEIGAAVQMWFEFRIATGRKSIDAEGENSSGWAAAIDYTVRKVNFHKAILTELAELYEIEEMEIRERYEELVETLDIMPCDYRYFRRPKNPLDKLVEAAAMLEELEEKFREM